MRAVFCGNRPALWHPKIGRSDLRFALRLAPAAGPVGHHRILAISKGSASQGLQLLRSLGAIHEAAPSAATPTFDLNRSGAVTPRASRGVAYEPELSLRHLVTGILRERIAPSASAGADRLKHLRQLAGQSPAHAAFYLERVSQLSTWSKRFTTVLPLLSALLGPGKKKSR